MTYNQKIIALALISLALLIWLWKSGTSKAYKVGGTIVYALIGGGAYYYLYESQNPATDIVSTQGGSQSAKNY